MEKIKCTRLIIINGATTSIISIWILFYTATKKNSQDLFFTPSAHVICEISARRFLKITRVEKFSKNYVRNALKCGYFSKSPAQKPYIIMRCTVLKCTETFCVFSKALTFLYGWIEIALKICKKCPEKSAETLARVVLKMRWNYVRSALNMRWNFEFSALFQSFSAFQRIQRFSYIISAHSAHLLQKNALKWRWHLDPDSEVLRNC